MKRSKAIGHIVDCHKYGPMICIRGLLYFGQSATMFANRGLAQKAMKATVEERWRTFQKDFEAEFGKLRILRVYDR